MCVCLCSLITKLKLAIKNFTNNNDVCIIVFFCLLACYFLKQVFLDITDDGKKTK